VTLRKEPDMLCYKSASELLALIANKDLSVEEVLLAHLEQIERTNPKVNAICTLVADQAIDQARDLDRRLAQGGEPGALFGLPIAIKDLNLTKGIRTTFGSPIYKDFVPGTDELFVERIKAAGALVIGKTNTPEFGAGSQTFNTLFGATRNPYDLGRTAGGSSGGAGAALACGMIPIADGSDLGGSVRNPANFNNVVGLRPSPGRIPRYPHEDAWDTMSVVGPMARSVADVALLLSVMAGEDPRDPVSISGATAQFDETSGCDCSALRVAWSKNLGQFPVQQAVLEVLDGAVAGISDLGCSVEEDHPDFSGAGEIFQTLRAASFAAGHHQDLADHRHLIKDSVIWNTERGLELSALDVSMAQQQRTRLYHRVRRFFERYNFLLLPVSQVVPFSIDTEWVEEIEGVKMTSYIDWMKSCSFITLTAHPAISVPCGFTGDGLPVGIQVVGKYRGEQELLRFAHALEQHLRRLDDSISGPPKLAL
jgi:amidase